MPPKQKERPAVTPPLTSAGATSLDTAFGCARFFLENRFVYLVLSARAGGLSVGLNMNPDKHCNFDCVYCEVDRDTPARESALDIDSMGDELVQTLEFVHSGRVREIPAYATLPAELLWLRQVALSGDGEPTLCPQFAEAVQAVAHVRARGRFPFFKMVLITNASGLDLPPVRHGLKCFTGVDEVWCKLDVGTQAEMDRINRAQVPLKKILANILRLGRRRPVVIQSLFAEFEGAGPSAIEIEEYSRRLWELKSAGAQIPLVQIYSATRPCGHAGCGHLPLRTLSRIAQSVRHATGLRVEVF